MQKLINGKLMDLTPEEIIEHDARSAAAEAARPAREWQQSMAESDKEMPRWAEDLFDLYTGAKTIEDLPELVQKVADKKALRGGKP